MLARAFPLAVLLVLSPCLTLAQEKLTLQVHDAASGDAIPARVTLRNAEGQAFFLKTSAPDGFAVTYDRKYQGPTLFSEAHTLISAHPAAVDLPAGVYTATIERGKEYLPAVQEVTISAFPVSLNVPLTRWINMASRGWYSADMHLHRELSEVKAVQLAEDLNVAFPLSYWVLNSTLAPVDSDRNLKEELPNELVRFDDTHVAWPHNTEYEIYMVGGRPFPLGSLLVLHHQRGLQTPAPPWAPAIAAARQQGAFFDIEKFSWPFSAVLPHLVDDALFELSNNHLWQAGFPFPSWLVPAPPLLQPPFGGKGGTERDWIHYTYGMYYTLLNSGLRLAPSAGSANGVLPTPAGYSRVYVHQPDGFDFDAWVEGLRAGRSVVTTGPMLMATANGQSPGEEFQATDGKAEIILKAELLSEQPIQFVELVVNGVSIMTMRFEHKQTPEGAYQAKFQRQFTMEESGWFALRALEDRPEGRVRHVHTAPWYVHVPGKPLQPSRVEKQYLVDRMTQELERSRSVLPAEAIVEYERALQDYEALPVRDDAADVAAESRPFRNDADRDAWLRNMRKHQYTPEEIRLATGLSYPEIESELQRLSQTADDAVSDDGDVLTVLPYPGGRHPRTGFLDGAIHPQRDTKLSVFLPWEQAGYVVVDLPEAVHRGGSLTYLAHTHIPTEWDRQGISLEPLEWTTTDDGAFHLQRELPNKVRFDALAVPEQNSLAMELAIFNGSEEPLTGLRAQVCVMLKGAVGFNAQTNQNKVIDGSFVAVKSDSGDRWIITSWTPIQRAWANPPCPCLHADPEFPDCAPGETVKATGRLWFYEGTDIDGEIQRLRKERDNSPS